MVKREFYKCDIRVRKAYFKRKRGKIIFLRKKVLTKVEERGIILKLSGEDAAER